MWKSYPTIWVYSPKPFSPRLLFSSLDIKLYFVSFVYSNSPVCATCLESGVPSCFAISLFNCFTQMEHVTDCQSRLWVALGVLGLTEGVPKTNLWWGCSSRRYKAQIHTTQYDLGHFDLPLLCTLYQTVYLLVCYSYSRSIHHERKAGHRAGGAQ